MPAPPTYQLYTMMPLNYQASGWFDIPQNCNGFMVTNVGDTVVTVLDQIFYPGVPGTSLGDSRTYGGNAGEVYKGQLKVAFAFPTGAAPNIEVVYKVYVNPSN